MKQQRLSEFRETRKAWIDELGNLLIEVFHYLALFVIGASITIPKVLAQ